MSSGDAGALPPDPEASTAGTPFRGRAAGLTHPGRVRNANEDAVILQGGAGVYGVADGMGGTVGGAFASRTIRESIAQAVTLFRPDHGLSERVSLIRSTIQRANQDIRAWADNLGVTGTGTTLMLLVLDPDDAGRGVVLHAGDSRVYRFRRGTLDRLTRDHSVAEALGLAEETAIPALLRHVVTNAIGIREPLELDESAVRLDRGDDLLLCTDGLYRMVSDPDIARIMGTPGPLDVRAQALLDCGLDHGGADNISLVLVDFDAHADVLPPTSEAETRGTDATAGRTPKSGRTIPVMDRGLAWARRRLARLRPSVGDAPPPRPGAESRGGP